MPDPLGRVPVVVLPVRPVLRGQPDRPDDVRPVRASPVQALRVPSAEAAFPVGADPGRGVSLMDAFSRLLLDDPTEPGPDAAAPPKVVFEPLPAERPGFVSETLRFTRTLPGPYHALVAEDGSYEPDLSLYLALPDQTTMARFRQYGQHLIRLESNTTRNEADREAQFRCWRRRSMGQWPDTLPADWAAIFERNQAEILQHGWLAVVHPTHFVSPPPSYLLGQDRGPLRFTSRETAERLHPRSWIQPYPPLWVGLHEPDLPGQQERYAFHHTYQSARLDSDVVLPCYDPERGPEEVAARIVIHGRTGVWPLGPLAEVQLERPELETGFEAPHPIENAEDPVPAPVAPQVLWDGTSMVPGGDLEWQQIVPFLRGWALMIPDVSVDSASRAWVVDEPEDPGVATLVLVSTVGAGRATVHVRSTEPLVNVAFDATPTTFPRLAAHGHLMQRMGEAAERLQTYLRVHLVGVRGPG